MNQEEGFRDESIGGAANALERWLVSGGDQRQPSTVQTSIKLGRVTVAGKPGDDLAPGTLSSILKQAGLKR